MTAFLDHSGDSPFTSSATTRDITTLDMFAASGDDAGTTASEKSRVTERYDDVTKEETTHYVTMKNTEDVEDKDDGVTEGSGNNGLSGSVSVATLSENDTTSSDVTTPFYDATTLLSTPSNSSSSTTVEMNQDSSTRAVTSASAKSSSTITTRSPPVSASLVAVGSGCGRHAAVNLILVMLAVLFSLVAGYASVST